MKLVEIGQDGHLPEVITLDDHLRMVVEMTVGHFEKVGFVPPWVGYIAIEDSVPVGTCAFKTPPVDGRVEIAYGTMPGFEGQVVSCDPLYSYSRNEIDLRIKECFDTVLEQTRLNLDAFIWTHGISTVEELGRVRMQAMATFLDDYTDGQAQQRYVATALPDLPFDSNRFDLALCSHFLFLYGSLGLNFHIRSVLDLVRVAREVRIFPLLQLDRERSPFLDAVISEVRNLGYVAEITRVAYEFQKDANEMLVVKRCEVT